MRLDKALLDLAAEQRSCVADWQARQLGASNTEVTRLKSSPRWELVGDHILVSSGAVHDERLMASAAVLNAGPGAALSHEAVTALWRVPGFSLVPPVVSQQAGHAWRRSTLGPVHDLVLVPERWITRLEGIRVVRPELAMYQLCGVLSRERAERTFDKFAARRLLTGRSARACLEDLQQRGRDGTVVYRDIIKARGDDYVGPASGLESRVKELGEEVGLELRRQVNLGGADWDARVDFYEDRAKVVFEVQSELYHWALSDREADAIRRAKLENDGFAVHELWDVDVWTHPGKVVRKMWTAVKSRKSPS
jgi:very-short-patch-repair endonuclease